MCDLTEKNTNITWNYTVTFYTPNSPLKSDSATEENVKKDAFKYNFMKLTNITGQSHK